MPNVPGSLLAAMHDHAGTVIGGTLDRSGPYVPDSINRRVFGNTSRQRK